ncbi:MAG: 1-phosphofructokinase [Lachnospiraceae bacterium]
MIYTVTLNPSIDYIISVKNFTLGSVNRTEKEVMFPGGKGINVSLVLKNMDVESTALGFVAGFTGEEIRKRIHEFGVVEEFIEVREGMSRINVKLHSNEESEINGRGPAIKEHDVKSFLQQLRQLKDGDVLVLAGSIPNGMPDTMYGDIMSGLKDKDVMVVVDATGDLLMNVLAYHPFLVKPNHHELGDIFDVEIHTREEAIPYARKLQDLGARNVLVSMAGEGAVLVAEDGNAYQSEAPKGMVVNSVGAGDSMVAGFLYGYTTKKSYEGAFYYGLCTGSASAFSENLATKEEVETLLSQLQ